MDRPIELYPPRAPRPAPLVVALHATCMEPASVCDAFGDTGRDNGWLVCPAGHGTCNDAPDWSGPSEEKASFLEQDLERVEARLSDDLDATPGVLFGWSRGAYAACDILRVAVTNPAHAKLSRRFRGLVLMAARARPDDATLRAAGIDRIVLAAGDQDGAAASMRASAVALKRSGFEVRYVSLGAIPHVWPNDFEARMSEPIAWALAPR
jgi:predicted esterase